MNYCPHCDGELLRHGVARKHGEQYGIRYKCRDCGKTFTVRDTTESARCARLHFNQTGRPLIKDWRMKDITEAART